VNLQVSIPSKTFLAGEYGVLRSGEALVITTEPKFRLNADLRNQSSVSGADGVNGLSLHPKSHAGRLAAHFERALRGLRLEWIDPHVNSDGVPRGGFGASTAQFIALYLVAKSVEDRAIPNLNHDLVDEIFALYLELSEPEAAPSGADLVAQILGGITDVSTKGEGVGSRKRPWPFLDLGFLIFRTGQKVETHQHLKTLQAKTLPAIGDMALAYGPVREAFLARESENFCKGINGYQDVLARSGFVAERTREILTELRTHPYVKAAKGCGAMGADTVLVVTEYDHMADVLQSTVENLGLDFVASHLDVASGAELLVRPAPEVASKVLPGSVP
jgi:mevalonate kinase